MVHSLTVDETIELALTTARDRLHKRRRDEEIHCQHPKHSYAKRHKPIFTQVRIPTDVGYTIFYYNRLPRQVTVQPPPAQ